MTASPAGPRPSQVIGAWCRARLWAGVLGCNGGYRRQGKLGLPGGCVVVANHCSHSDTPAVLAGLPADHAPVVAAAADYWFGPGTGNRLRAGAARGLVAAFGVRRGSGGFDDLLTAVPLLRQGRIVVLFPEGTRSRDGELAAFHSGAQRLAQRAGVPLVPVTVRGTRKVLPVHGRVHRGPVTVTVGDPVADLAAARRQIQHQLAEPPALT